VKESKMLTGLQVHLIAFFPFFAFSGLLIPFHPFFFLSPPLLSSTIPLSHSPLTNHQDRLSAFLAFFFPLIPSHPFSPLSPLIPSSALFCPLSLLISRSDFLRHLTGISPLAHWTISHVPLVLIL